MKREILKAIIASNKPVHLILHVTNRCNLRCKTCFVDFDKLKGEELTLEEIKKISKYLDKLVWLDISGGEPFLRNDLPEICSLFKTRSISIPTNGFDSDLILKSTKKIKEKIKGELMISLSIDGFENTNDNIRAEGCFKKSIETLKKLKELSEVKVKVNTVLCEKNYGEIIDFMKYIKEFDVDFHSVIFLRGRSRDSSFRCPEVEKLEEIKDDVFKIWATYNYGFGYFDSRILRNYQKIMYETSLKIMKEKRQIPDCLAYKHHLVVYANGDTAFCEMLEPFGNLRKADLKTLLKSEKAEEQRKHIKEKKCYCYHNCNMIDNFFLNPSMYPKLISGHNL